MVDDLTASPDHIQAHLDALCADIGNRLAASDAERRAGEYCRDYLQSLGLESVTTQQFPFHHWGWERCEVAVSVGEGWLALDAIPVANSRPTPEGGIEAELVYVDNALPADLARADVRGKVLLVWGGHGGDTSKLQALNDCGAAGVIWVDERLPFDWPVSVGTPYDWRDICRLPQVCIPWADAWEIVATLDGGVSRRVRMTSDVWSQPAPSLNVFGDLPGSGEELVHIGGHLDSVVVGTGADDDASGVAVTLEVARLLVEADVAPLRTVRFCGWGAEEQLSEGSRQYVAAHPDEVARTRLCVNLDSVGSIAGRNEVRVVGPPELTGEVRALVGYTGSPDSEVSSVGYGSGRGTSEPSPDPSAVAPATGDESSPEASAKGDLTATVLEEVSPFSDMFAFNAWGVPSVWLYRVNMPGMRFHHHSHLDDLPVVSARQVAMAATACARLVHTAATTEDYYPRTIPAALEAEIRQYAARYYGW